MAKASNSGVGREYSSGPLKIPSIVPGSFPLCLLMCLTISVTLPLEGAQNDKKRDEQIGKQQPTAVIIKQEGSVTGTMIDANSKRPVESVAVTLKMLDGTVVQGALTDSSGIFTLDKISPGDYFVAYGQVGGAVKTTEPFTVDGQHARLELGNLNPADNVVRLEKFVVTAKQEAQMNSIDRKIYNVGKEIQSTTGSASDLLQNVPSVDVDIDGNVSLRGSEDVLIMINGRTSALMGKNRAEALQQIPADSIDKIEVITNPSAKYKPDGTAGIINISLKRKHDSGFSGTLTTNAGNNQRYNTGLTLNYNPGSYNIFGAVSLRQDYRPRTVSDIRTIIDPVTGVVTHADKQTYELARPFTSIARLGFDYAPNQHNQFSMTGNYNNRTLTRNAVDHNLLTNAAGTVTSDYDRTRFDPEYERTLEAAATYQHSFTESGHELKAEVRASRNDEQEDNHYTDIFRTPIQVPTFDNIRFNNGERTTEGTLEYTRPLENDAKLELGYNGNDDHYDADISASFLDPGSGLWMNDSTKSSRFLTRVTIHAFYATYRRAFGKLGLLVGVRPELAYTNSQLITTAQTVPNNYTRIYPSLHLSYQLTDEHEFQLNYSRRVHRPRTEDLNPFPEFVDPFNLRAGNPHLMPEDIHSVEAGYGFHRGDTGFTATAYYRLTYDGFTNVTQDLGNGVLLTTFENLAVNRAAGLELTANTALGHKATLNLSSNTFYNTIDASNLGFSSSESNVSWLAKIGVTLHLTKDTMVQFNGNYTSARLTPQGMRRPTYVANIGLRHDVWQKKAAFVLTVSDLLNSLKDENVINTPLLQEDVVRRRSSRIIYLGFIYNFGRPSKKAKDELLKFDNSL